MMIRIGQKYLHGTVRSELCIINQRNALCLEGRRRCVCIIDFKRKMVIATGLDQHFYRISSRAAAIMFRQSDELTLLRPETTLR